MVCVSRREVTNTDPSGGIGDLSLNPGDMPRAASNLSSVGAEPKHNPLVFPRGILTLGDCMTKENSRRKAQEYLQKARQHLKESSLHKRLRRDDLIAAVRKTREELWEAKLAGACS